MRIWGEFPANLIQSPEGKEILNSFIEVADFTYEARDYYLITQHFRVYISELSSEEALSIYSHLQRIFSLFGNRDDNFAKGFAFYVKHSPTPDLKDYLENLYELLGERVVGRRH